MITNLVLFKVVWALSLYGVISNWPSLGPLALIAFVLCHAWLAPTVKADFMVAMIAMAVGLLLDTLYLRVGLIAYNGNEFWSGAAPLWIIALWANFALTMNGCLAWLQDRRWLASFLAFISGPLSYVGGIALGVATVTGDAWLLYATIGIAWAITVPVLLSTATQFSRRFHPELHPA